MKHIVSIWIILYSILALAQDRNVQTKIEAENIFELSIIRVYPDSFPKVSVVFQAKNKYGKPLWLLKKKELKISENNIQCDVLRLINITENKPLNIGLIVDHSGSMLENPEVPRKRMDEISNLYFNGYDIPTNFTSSLDYAKEGILEFLNSSANSSDSILFVAFSETVDKIFPLTNDISGIRAFMSGIEPSGPTAFYDAIYLALDSLSAHSTNSAIIAMTDGHDNSSVHGYDEVINKAKAKNIPIYIIGLGDVDKEGLKRMSKLTDGFYLALTPDSGDKIVLFDVIKTTQHPKEKCPDGYSDFNPMKLYTSGDLVSYMNDNYKKLEVLWDDWKLYANKKP